MLCGLETRINGMSVYIHTHTHCYLFTKTYMPFQSNVTLNGLKNSRYSKKVKKKSTIWYNKQLANMTAILIKAQSLLEGSKESNLPVKGPLEEPFLNSHPKP